MRIVDRLWKSPHRCVVRPHITQQTDGVRWIDTDGEVDHHLPQHVYVSDVAVREMMVLLGYPLPEEVAELRKDLAAAEDFGVEQADLIAELEGKLAAVGLLEASGMAVRRKPEEVAA